MPRWLDDADPAVVAARAEYQEAQSDRSRLEVADARPPEYSDEALALRFAEKHAGEARFVAAWGRWLFWTGARWQFDLTMGAFDLARRICRIASGEIIDPKATKLASAVASAKTVAAVVSLARADRRHAGTSEQWDQDPWLLTTKGNADE